MTKQERYEGVINYFKTNVPIAETELNYSNPFELLVAVILSAQCTDKRINQVTPKLFKDFPTPEALAASNSDNIFTYIRSVSYPNNKANHLVNMAKMLVTDFNSTIPSEIDELVKLPGVGRKTANVIASVIYEKPTMAVDTHVFRVSNRIGLTKATNPLQSELQLVKHIPEQYIATAHHWLILHGRYTCMARSPKCDVCPLTHWCHYFETNYLKKSKKLLSDKQPTMATKVIKPATKKAKAVKAEPKKSVVKTVNKKETAASKVATNAKVSTTRLSSAKTSSTTKMEAKKVTPAKKEVSTDKFVAHSTGLTIGDKAPMFKAKDQSGKLISLSDFKGKNIVLYFYPKDNTPGCTLEACSLRDEHAFLSKKNYVVLGVSADDEKMHKKFADKFSLPFSLLADTNKEIISAYDVWGKKQFMGKIFDGIIRTTFIINEKWIISNIIKDVKTKEHGKQILAGA